MDNKKAYIDLLNLTQRDGMDKLIEYLEENNFFTAPASTKFHMNGVGGLLTHSLNVYDKAICLKTTLIKEKSLEYMNENDLTVDNIVIASLLHDIGKIGDYGKPLYKENILKSGKQSPTKPYETNKDLAYIPHEVRSVVIANRFISLTENEEFAIYNHNGMYTNGKYDLNGKERPLQTIIHFADLWVSRFEEK